MNAIRLVAEDGTSKRTVRSHFRFRPSSCERIMKCKKLHYRWTFEKESFCDFHLKLLLNHWEPGLASNYLTKDRNRIGAASKQSEELYSNIYMRVNHSFIFLQMNHRYVCSILSHSTHRMRYVWLHWYAQYDSVVISEFLDDPVRRSIMGLLTWKSNASESECNKRLSFRCSLCSQNSIFGNKDEFI